MTVERIAASGAFELRTRTWMSLLAALVACGPLATPRQRPVIVDIEPAPAGRLGDNVRPVEAQLELEIDPDLAVFRGRVAIDVDIARPTRSIWLHGKELTFRGAELTAAGAAPMIPSAIDANSDTGLLGLHFDALVPAGRAQLAIDFGAAFRDIDGVFKQKHAGQWYAYTDFEPTDARRAFPCFDDPRFKISWSISLIVPRQLEAFSNMPVAVETRLGETRKRVDFVRTTPLSSYLVAAAVGPFEIVESSDASVPIRVLTPRGLGPFGKFALEIIAPMLTELEAYFGMKSPYPKLDFVAVPRFSGAMENPGLVTIAAGILLVDPARTPEADQEFLAGVIAHELAHLWFGDLVTMQWWDDLWLNEAFATWMSIKLVEAWRPAMKGRFLEVADRVSALREDRWPTSRAIKEPLRSEAEVGQSFDLLTYRKGGAIVGMLERLAGPDPFSKAMRSYVRGHAFGSAATGDLLALLDSAQKNVVSSYLNQSGVPVIRVDVSCDGAAPVVRLEQSPYQLLSSKDTEPTRWHIPLCLGYGHDATESIRCTVLSEQAATVSLDTTECPTWVRPNLGGVGYYYVSMSSDRLWSNALLRADDETETLWMIDAIDAQWHAGRIKPALVLTLLRVASQSPHAQPTSQIARMFFELDNVLEDRNPLAPALEAAIGKRARSAGLTPRPDESRRIRETRPDLVGAMARVGRDVELRKQARALVKTWLDGGEMPALLGLTLRVAALGGDAALFDALLDRMRRDSSLRIHIAIGSALGSFEDPALTRRALALLVDSDLDWQPKLSLVAQTLLRREAHGDAVSFLTEHAGEVPAQILLDLPTLAASLCETEHGAAVAALMETQPDVPDEQKRRTLDQIGQCSALRAFAKE